MNLNMQQLQHELDEQSRQRMMYTNRIKDLINQGLIMYGNGEGEMQGERRYAAGVNKRRPRRKAGMRAYGLKAGINAGTRGYGARGGARRKRRGGATSAWINHVKRYAASHGVSYKDALSMARASYKGSGGVLIGGRKRKVRRAKKGGVRKVRKARKGGMTKVKYNRALLKRLLM